jgi:hypothetical protein
MEDRPLVLTELSSTFCALVRMFGLGIAARTGSNKSAQ